ncbi:MAG: DUF4153 domain-containing protein [Paludibacter sp.]
MKKLSFKTGIAKLKIVFVRFPFTLLFVIGLSVLCFLSIQKVKVEIHESLWAFFVLGILLNVAVTLFLEEFKKVSLRILFNLLSTILLAVYCLSLPDKLLAYHYYQMIALGIVFVLAAFYVSFFKKSSDIPFWDFSRESLIQLFISGVFSLILYAGLGLAILSLDKLFNIDIDKKVYSDLAVVCFVIFGPIYFLSNIPDEIEKRRQEFSFHKIIRIFGLYILLPILAAYTLILYVYLFQIIIKWELPNGWVSTLVSVLGLGGFLCIFILYPLRLNAENKVVNLFSRYFSLLLMPLLVLMSIGIFRRLDDYGLTINRLYVLILNVWLYGICIYLFISRAHHLKWIVITFSAVLFLSSIGPWSVFSITKRTLLKEIEQIMTDAKLLNDGKVVENQNEMIKVDSIQANKLSADVKYTCQNFGTISLQSYFVDSIQNMNYREINKKLGIDKTDINPSEFSDNQKDKYRYFDINQQFNQQVIDIKKDFRSYIRLQRPNDQENVYVGNDLIIRYVNNIFVISKPIDKKYNIEIPLKSKIKEILKRYKPKTIYSADALTIDGENYKLIINNLTGFYYQKTDSVTVTNIEADLFLK